MPILEMQVVGTPPDSAPHDLARRLAEAVGEVLGAKPQTVWVKVQYLSLDEYAENGGGPDEGVRPVFVRVLHAHPPAQAALQSEVRILTHTIATTCARPQENVHISYDPPGAGRIAFGGRLIE